MHSNKGLKGDMTKEALIDYVKLLRFGPRGSQQPGRVFTEVAEIARLVRCSET
jgi:hypothetical protein